MKDLPFVAFNGIWNSGKSYVELVLYSTFADLNISFGGFDESVNFLPPSNHIWSGHVYPCGPYSKESLPGLAMQFGFGNYVPFLEGENKANYKFINHYRDPRDAFVSACAGFKSNPFDSSDRTIACIKTCIRESTTIGTHIGGLNYFLSIEYAYNTQFERFSFAPYTTFSDMFDFMQYPKQTSMLKEAIKNTVRTSKIGQWVHSFDDEIEAEFKRQSGGIVSHLGYEADENWSYKDYAGMENMTEWEYWTHKPRPAFIDLVKE